MEMILHSCPSSVQLLRETALHDRTFHRVPVENLLSAMKTIGNNILNTGFGIWELQKGCATEADPGGGLRGGATFPFAKFSNMSDSSCLSLFSSQK